MQEKRRVVLHIGAGKCGSSSLQRSLSLTPNLVGSDGTNYRYTVVSGAGQLLDGPEVTSIANKSVHGYAASANVISDKLVAATRKAFAELPNFEDGITPVLSCEGWITKPDVFRDFRLLGENQLGADVIIYVRPQLDWLNSAWWQWGAWVDHTREYWMKRNLDRTRWNRVAREWADIEGVSSVSIRLATTDTVADFSHLLGVQLPRGSNINASNDGLLVRFLQHYRTFRSGPHDPYFEFAFARWAPGPRRPLPWVLPHDEGKRYLANLRADNEALLEMLAADVAAQMRDDARWWSVEPYLEREVEPESIDTLAADAYGEMLGRAFAAFKNRMTGTPASDAGDPSDRNAGS